jgi:large subunit ribosomal protein L21
MEKYIVLKIGTRQYTVKENEVFEVERQEKPFKADVLFYSDGAKTLIGDPVVKEVTVKLSAVAEKRDRKIRVNRFKSKSRYRTGKGHRQHLSILKVEKISMAGEKEEVVKVEPVKVAKPVVTKVAKVAKVKKPVKAKEKPAAKVKKVSKKLPKKIKK